MPSESMFEEIRRTLGGWLAGQLKISAILAAIYAVGFGIGHLPFWLLVGVVCGALNLIPWLGPLLAFALALLVWLFSDADSYTLLAVVITFAFAQGLEGFFLTPRILGRSVSLSPWIVFLSILIGGAVFSIWGMVLAVPLVAVLAIVWRRAGRQRA